MDVSKIKLGEETYNIKDANISAWARAAAKPTYTASEVGAMANTHPANAITSAKISQWDGKMERVNLGLEYDDVNDSFSFFEEEWDNPITHSRFRELCNSKYVFLLDNSNGVYCAPTELNEDNWSFFGVIGSTDYSCIFLNWDSTNNKVVGNYFYSDWYFVPTSRTINGKALSSNITLTASDVGAMPTTHAANSITSAKISKWDGSYVPLFIQISGTTITFKDTNNTAVSHSDVYSMLNDSTKNVVLFESGTSFIYYNGWCEYADEFHFVSAAYDDISYLYFTYNNGTFTLQDQRTITVAEKVGIALIPSTGAVSQALDANKFYKFTGALTSLTLTLNASTGFAVYAGKFTTGSGWGSNGLSIPATVTEAANNDEIEASKTYEFSIVDNVIVVKEV